eukprot:403342621
MFFENAPKELFNISLIKIDSNDKTINNELYDQQDLWNVADRVSYFYENINKFQGIQGKRKLRENKDQQEDLVQNVNVTKMLELQNFKRLNRTLELLQYALQDEQVTKFVILTESCMPVYSFKLIYDTLMKNDNSYLDISPFNVRIRKQEKYKALFEVFNVDEIVAHKSQLVLNRDHAQYLVDNRKAFLHFWTSFEDKSFKVDFVAIGTSLAHNYQAPNIQNLCISYKDLSIPGHFRTFNTIKIENVIDARQRCLFLSDVEYHANIEANVFPLIFGKQKWKEFADQNLLETYYFNNKKNSFF